VTGLLWELRTAGTEGGDGGFGPSGELLAYFPDQDDLEATLRTTLAPLRARVQEVPVADVDWVARFRETFRAFRAGPFVIAPAWDPPPAEPHVLLVEPGVAFGTGTHETTRLCLAALGDLAQRRPLGDVADIGAGSALLAVAAARLGARRVAAVELDAEALPWARRHLELNAAPVWLVRGDGGRALRRQGFDVVLANLTTGLLVERAGELASLLRPAGALVVSGLLAADLSEVRPAFEPHGRAAVRTDGEWACLVVEVA
jgi:ribosomal protein L11 methyltransferase